MVLIVAIIFYALFVVGLILLLGKVFKNENTKKKVRKGGIISAFVLFPVFVFVCFCLLIGLATEDHLDVKRGSFIWYALFDGNTVTDFPVIDPVDGVVYNTIGGDHHSTGGGWEVEYLSKGITDTLVYETMSFLKEEGFDLKETNHAVWDYKFNKSETSLVFSGRNGTETVELIVEKQGVFTKIKCIVVM